MNPAGELRVRLAQLADLDAVVKVRRDAILGLAPEHMTTEEAAAWAHRPDRPERCRTSIEAQRLWLADREGDPVAWLEVTADCVDGLYVVPSRWRLGIGSRLMNMAESLIRDQGFDSVRLNAASAALSFYEGLGYTASGSRQPGRGTPMMKLLR